MKGGLQSHIGRKTLTSGKNFIGVYKSVVQRPGWSRIDMKNPRIFERHRDEIYLC